MKYLRIFENFEEYNPYDLLVLFPSERHKMILQEVTSSKPNLKLVGDLITIGADLDWQDEDGYERTLLMYATIKKHT
jgi:hypothetical protein